MSATQLKQPNIDKLLTMLTYKRPANSPSEHNFIRRYLISIGAKPDKFRNHWLTIRGNDKLLFCSHTDTVHRTSGIQPVHIHKNIATTNHGECLGADDTVGVWLMLEMIRARIPATYLFHAAEEMGGIGSSNIAQHTPERITNHHFAIALDRKGTSDIITHQWEGRTASDAFATQLANLLKPLTYRSSQNGTFTDTANYAHIIPECTNISVGYDRQHMRTEYLDIAHAARLRDALVAADWSSLVKHREPTKPVRDGYTGYGSHIGAYGDERGWSGHQQEDQQGDQQEDDYPPNNHQNDDAHRTETMEQFVRREYAATADYLESLGFDRKSLRNAIFKGLRI